MVRKAHLALFAALLAAGCGGSSAPKATVSARAEQSCAGVLGKHHVYVLVVNQGAVLTTSCVGFDGADIDALSLMRRSLIEFGTQKFSFGTGVCQVDNVPAHYSQCLPQNEPYWADWIWKSASWQMAQSGPEQIKLADREALGWVYTPQTGSPARPPAPPKF
jgi:hypothetical protein